MSLLKEPLVHFLAAGAALFGLYRAVSPGGSTGAAIVVDEGRIASLTNRFSSAWNRPPNAEELRGLVDDFIVEEMLYREALALGMDRGDSMIRRHMRHKMELIAADAATTMAYDDETLGVFLAENAERYRSEARYTFEQIYVSPDSSSGESDDRVARVRERLRRGEPVARDESLLPARFENATAFEVDKTLGRGFAAQLDALPVGQWSDALRTGLGIHFVRVSAREPSRLPPLSEIRDAVERDWLLDKSQELKDELIESLLAKYAVEIEWPTGTNHTGTPQ